MLRPEIIASITPRHGAYLISFDHSEHFADDTPIEQYDAAASLTVAKRIVKDGARDAGCTHLKWVQGGGAHGFPPTVTLLVGVTPEPKKDVY